MSNIYYNNPDDFVQGDVIRPGDVDGEFNAIETGCDLIEVNTNRALTVPAGETIEITQNAAARVNKIMAFGAAGLPDLGRSLTAFDADVVQVAADKVSTNADVVLTHADVVLTNADVVLAEADKVQTGLDRTAVAADLVATNQDTIDTAADLVLTNADVVTTAANVVLSEADVVLTNADVVTAGNSVTAAAGQVTLATNQVTLAAGQVTLAAGQVTLATGQVTLATEQATLATTAKTAAELALDQFTDQYLGAKASDPSLDNDGNALITGALYFNSSLNNMRIYNSLGAWTTAAGVSNPDFSITRENFIATAGQTVFNLAQQYTVGINSIMIYVNGIRMKKTADYAETNNTRITFATGLTVSDEVLFEHGVVSNGTSPAGGNVTYTPTGRIAAGNVQDAITEVALESLAAVVDDTSPQLGGNLALGSFDIPVSPTQQTALNLKFPAPVLTATSLTAVKNNYYTATVGGITITLPASPSVGDYLAIKDGTGAAATTTFTVARNGSKIASSATDLVFDKNFADIVMTYVNSTIGWSV